MARQQFSQPINVTASSSKSVTFISATSATGIPAGLTEKLYLYAPSKSVARVKSVLASFPVTGGSTSGQKTLKTTLEKGGTAVNGVLVKGTHSEGQSIDYMRAAGGSVEVHPADLAAFTATLGGLAFDATTGLVFHFINNTDVTQTANRFAYVFVELEVIS